MSSLETLAALRTFLAESLEENLQRSLTTDLETHLLQLFHSTVTTVPAYRHFLETQGIDPQTVQS